MTNLIGALLVVMSVNVQTQHAEFVEVSISPTNVMVFASVDKEGKPVGEGQTVTLNTESLTGKSQVIPVAVRQTMQLGLRVDGKDILLDNRVTKTDMLKVDLPRNWKLKGAAPAPKKKKVNKTKDMTHTEE